jgi:general secretion pathway protein D
VSPVGLINFTNTGNNIADVINSAVDVANGGTVPTPAGNVLLGGGKFDPDSNFNYLAVINMLASDSNTNILSTPTLVTLDNEEAEIIIGQNVPFVTGSFTSTGAGNDATNPFQTIQREDVGLTLKIKPQINEGDALKSISSRRSQHCAERGWGLDIIITSARSRLRDGGRRQRRGAGRSEEQRANPSRKSRCWRFPGVGACSGPRAGQDQPDGIYPSGDTPRLGVAESSTSSKYNYFRAINQEGKDGVNLLPGKQAPVLPEWGNTTPGRRWSRHRTEKTLNRASSPWWYD